jgi:hypothetical protein
MMNPKSRPERMPGIELQATGSELLAHDTRNDEIHVLNVTAGRILTLCDGEHNVDQIVDSIVAEWNIERDLASEDVRRQLQDFTERGMIVPFD